MSVAITQNLPTFLFGLLFTLIYAWVVSILMRLIKRDTTLINLNKELDDKWKKAFLLSDRQQVPAEILGLFESVITFLSFFIERPELIGGWLTFKLASKWQTWSSIIKLPEKIENLDDIDYLGAKNRLASHTLHRWLLGTLGNILAGSFGFISALIVAKFIGK